MLRSLSKQQFVNNFRNKSIDLGVARKRGNLGGLKLKDADKNGDGKISGNKEAGALFSILDRAYDQNHRAQSMTIRDANQAPTPILRKLKDVNTLAELSARRRQAHMATDARRAKGKKPVSRTAKPNRGARKGDAMAAIDSAIQNVGREASATQMNRVLGAYNKLNNAQKKIAKNKLAKSEAFRPMVANIDNIETYITADQLPDSVADWHSVNQFIHDVSPVGGAKPGSSRSMEDKYNVNREVLAKYNPHLASDLRQGRFLGKSTPIAIPKNAGAERAFQEKRKAEVETTYRLIQEPAENANLSLEQRRNFSQAFVPNFPAGNRTAIQTATAWGQDLVKSNLSDPENYLEPSNLNPLGWFGAQQAVELTGALAANQGAQLLRQDDANEWLSDVVRLRQSAPRGATPEQLLKMVHAPGIMMHDKVGFGDKQVNSANLRAKLTVALYMKTFGNR